MAVPGVPLFVLEEAGRRRIEAPVSEAYLAMLRPGAPVEIVLDDAPDNVLRSTVSEIAPSIDPATRTFLVKSELPAGKGRAGQSGRIRFASGKGTALAVPSRAITRTGGSEGVFVVGTADNVARLRFITTGTRFGDRVEVLSGLSPGDRVAVSPLDRIQDGAVVGTGK
jgi:RND family efflux transporter MFP subunit